MLSFEDIVGATDGIEIIVDFPYRELKTNGEMTDQLSTTLPPPLLDFNGVLTVASRTHQPEFTIGPELVLIGQQ